ncbi:MAG: hypothetical protein ACI82Z_000500 [Cellvibrionaceae bacterium]|jgi:uncharacterized protein YqeY
MCSQIKATVQKQMKLAMKAKDKPRLGIIRLIWSEFKRVEVDERIELDDGRVLAILDRMVKQRRDSARQFADAGRLDLSDKENYEISVINEFLPEPLTEDEIITLIDETIQNVGSGGMQAMGEVMKLLKPKLQARADIGKVSSLVKAKLIGSQ